MAAQYTYMDGQTVRKGDVFASGERGTCKVNKITQYYLAATNILSGAKFDFDELKMKDCDLISRRQ